MDVILFFLKRGFSEVVKGQKTVPGIRLIYNYLWTDSINNRLFYVARARPWVGARSENLKSIFAFSFIDP